MSHIPQRKEKDCLNCGTTVVGKYCHVCGQENVVPKETFWHMVTHFFYDIVHFDSKFFATLKDLLFRPGFLSKEYMRGRRASFLHPIKMYVFTSAIFFLVFFSFFANETVLVTDSQEFLTKEERIRQVIRFERKLKRDTAAFAKDSVKQRQWRLLQELRDTTVPVTWDNFAMITGDFMVVNISGASEQYTSVEQYDSTQQSLDKSKRDGWFKKRLIRKELSINAKYRNNPSKAKEKMADSLLHRLPYLLFVSLPLFALILRLLYLRRKNFYYADHAVFTIHLYIFSFIVLLLVFFLNKLKSMTGWDFIGLVIGLLFVLLNVYLYKAMRKFYDQGFFKTFIKYLMTALISLIMMMLLLVMFFFFSAIEL